jgi:hypothetical protein
VVSVVAARAASVAPALALAAVEAPVMVEA